VVERHHAESPHQTLRATQRDGLVTRTAYDENRPRVEYELTPLGRGLPTLAAAAAPELTSIFQRCWNRAEHMTS
jgi:DNA-binding PadR family transcriptional regulator